MQQIVLEEPYKFVPPVCSDWWPHILRFYLRRYMRKVVGVYSVECRGVERLRASLDAGHSIVVAPNHSRISDPLVLGELAMQAHCYFYAMASWHLFKQDRLTRFLIRRMGAFSVYREGPDRQAIDTAIDILLNRHRPLVMFPEGVLTRHNDKIGELMDGPAFICRQVAKRLKKQSSSRQVVIHPIAIRYAFQGDVPSAIKPVLDEFEARFSWQPQRQLSLVERIAKIGRAVLALKELEFLGNPRQGDTFERTEYFVNHVLADLESRWQLSESSEGVVARVKRLRTVILADMVAGKVSPEERDRRWRDLAACYYVQQISHYPRDYILPEMNLPERIVETVERLEEDFVDVAHKFEPFHTVIKVGEAIPVGAQRDRSEAGDPVMIEVKRQLQTMIDELAAERTPV